MAMSKFTALPRRSESGAGQWSEALRKESAVKVVFAKMIDTSFKRLKCYWRGSKESS